MGSGTGDALVAGIHEATKSDSSLRTGDYQRRVCIQLDTEVDRLSSEPHTQNHTRSARSTSHLCSAIVAINYPEMADLVWYLRPS